ncbi:MAG: hypothetical protein CVU48_09840 [Candidatus Cloacimonetes bacterium HGW-Cloacimonetes-1]|jgi:hypothetical protein|nr:MAG: hypothetical protein CVU48_09840 [Candidatus Cloacimonetes bacterium HGW-Cloacimonetes-1]
MERYILEATKYTPYIELDTNLGTLQVMGDSYPENALELYQPLLTRIDAYFADNIKKLDIYLQIDYLNTSSSKMLIDIFTKLSYYFDKGNQISAVWKYPEDDEDYREQCMMFLEEAHFPYQLVGLAY